MGKSVRKMEVAVVLGGNGGKGWVALSGSCGSGR